MKQGWVPRREAESDWADPAAQEPVVQGSGADHPEWVEDEADAPRSKTRTAALWVLGVLAVAWVALVAANGADPEIARRWAWMVNLVAVAAAPLLVLGGIAALLSRRPSTPAIAFGPGDAERATEQARQAMAMLGEAQAQLANQAREAAALADRSTNSIFDSIAVMASQTQQLEQSSATSLTSVGALGDRVTAMADTLPRLEDRLATLGETLAGLGGNLGQRHDTLDQQLRATALVAEEARLQLMDAGKALELQLGGLRDGARETGEELSNLSELSSARLDLTMDRVKSVVDSTEQRLETQNAALTTLVEQSRAAIEQVSNNTLERFSNHCREVGMLLDDLDGRLAGQAEKSQSWLTETTHGAATLTGAFDALEQSTLARTTHLSAIMKELSGNTRSLTENLAEGHDGAEMLIKRTEAMLVALDSGVRELDESLPAAVARVETRLGAMHDRILSSGPALEAVEAVATGVVSQLRESDQIAGSQIVALGEALRRSQDALSDQKTQVAALADAVEEAGKSMAQVAESVGPQMVEALVRVRETADAAATRAREAIGGVIPGAANELAQASGAAVKQALASTVTAELERLSLVADDAVKAAHQATEKLTQQMLSVTDASKELDRTLAAGTERMEAQDRELMAERSATLIGALGEHAIDVGKWFQKEIADPDWNAYLKGDRGLFARRATRLVNGAEGKQVQALYQDDPEFREHVNRYIRDFEILLRTVMATKDGGTLALTMISSDIGKLYVALAQAIERLRPN